MFHNKNPKSFVFNFWGSLQVCEALCSCREIVKSELAKKIFLTKSLHNSKKCTTFAVENRKQKDNTFTLYVQTITNTQLDG